MSKKKNHEQEIAEKEINSEEINFEETAASPDKEHKEEVKISPTTEELLALEKDKNLRIFAEFENFRKIFFRLFENHLPWL